MQKQPLIGFLLASTAAVMWSLLPIALQPILTVMDAQTIVWFRFITAAIGIFLLLLFTGKLPKRGQFSKRYCIYTLMGIIGLAGNFYLYNFALNYIPATTSQILSSSSSFLLILSGIVLFKERLGLHQKIGFILLIIGLPLFFNDRFADFTEMNNFVFGIFIGTSASVIWVCYGLAQKMMLDRFNSQQILLMIYIGCSLFFTPFAETSQLSNLSGLPLVCLIFCCLNTLIAYSCYGEALNRWELSNVSMIMPQIPILTIIFSQLAHWLNPTYFPESNLNLLSYIGAIFVVMGALSAAAGHKILYRRQMKKLNK